MILRGEVLPPEVYGRLRGGVRAAIAAESRVRRVEICPGLRLYFESRQSLWFHLHELLHATTWNEDAIREELVHINKLIPAERGLVATAASEEDAYGVGSGRIGGTWSLRLCGQLVRARDIPLQDIAATPPGVRHLFFRIHPVQALLLKTPGLEVDVCVESGGRVHWVLLSESARQTISSDLGVHSAVEAS
ncbi:MAG: DUF3501 family protein [Burkholderiales bacterium]